MAVRASSTVTYLKRLDGQGENQGYHWQQAAQSAGTPIDNVRLLALLPFEILRQHLKTVMLRQFETALGICDKQAAELDNALVKHVDDFEKAVKAELERIYGVWY